jgi:hypothetical protein
MAPSTLVPRTLAVHEHAVHEAVLEAGVVVRLDIPMKPGGAKPAVIVYRPEQPDLLAAGYVVVTYRIDWARLTGAPPAPPPASGGTVGKWILASPSAGVLGQAYLQTIAVNAEQAMPRVIDYLAGVPDVDSARIGIVGASTHGFMALHAAAADERLTAAVVLQACGDYHSFLRFSSLGMNGAPLALEPAYDAWLREHAPVSHPDRLVHAAVLLVIRSEDPIIPVACADETAAVLGEAYARAGVPERFRFVRWPAGGHGLGEPERQESQAWLQRWLRP